MTVTINTLGTNSKQIVISAETSATNIINAINTSLTSLGWTLIDTLTSGSRGLLTTKVYSAPNADTVTTKYMIIRYDLQRQYWFTSCCESWNVTTHVATNESWYGGRQILLPLQYGNTILYVFATARYACFMGVVNGEPGPWQGVFEFEREAAEDIAANTVPCFGWTNSLCIGEPFGNFVVPVAAGVPANNATSTSNGFVSVGFAPPRTANSQTGISAANNFAILTGLGQYPPSDGVIPTDYSAGGITQAMSSHCAMLGGFNEGSNGYVWNNNKTVISNIKLAGYASAYIVGKIYGLKITVKLGAPLNTTVIPVDANLFYDPVGTNTAHALLGIHGGYKDRMVSATNRLTAVPYTSNTALGTPYQSVLVSGRYIYITTSTGFHKFDTQNTSFTYNILPAGAFQMVKFDGVNALYVSTGTTTVYKLNLSDETYSTYTSSVAVSGLAIDDDNLYAVSNNNTGTTGTIKKVALSTFTEAASYSITYNATGNFTTHVGMADYGGYLFVGVLSPTSNATGRIFRIVTSDGTSSFLNPPANTLPGGISGAQPLFYDGTSLYFVIGCSTGGNSSLQTIINKVSVSPFAYTQTMSLSGGGYSNINYMGIGANTMGSFEPPSFGGMQIYFLNNGQFNLKIPFSDPRIPSGVTAIPSDSAVSFDTVTTVNTGQPATDHCSYYTFNSTQVIRYQNAYRNFNFNGVQTANLLIPQ